MIPAHDCIPPEPDEGAGHWLAGQFGIKYIFLVSVLGFTVFSALAGSATSLPQLVIYRVMQGICGAALVPLSQSVLLSINPPERHGPAMAVWGMGVMLGPIMGPAVGGWLTEEYSWRWVFYINVPLGVLAFVGVSAFVTETKLDRVSRLDWLGFGTLSVAIAALQLALDRGEQLGWFGSGEIILESVVCASATVSRKASATPRRRNPMTCATGARTCAAAVSPIWWRRAAARWSVTPTSCCFASGRPIAIRSSIRSTCAATGCIWGSGASL